METFGRNVSSTYNLEFPVGFFKCEWFEWFEWFWQLNHSSHVGQTHHSLLDRQFGQLSRIGWFIPSWITRLFCLYLSISLGLSVHDLIWFDLIWFLIASSPSTMHSSLPLSVHDNTNDNNTHTHTNNNNSNNNNGDSDVETSHLLASPNLPLLSQPSI